MKREMISFVSAQLALKKFPEIWILSLKEIKEEKKRNLGKISWNKKRVWYALETSSNKICFMKITTSLWTLSHELSGVIDPWHILAHNPHKTEDCGRFYPPLLIVELGSCRRRWRANISWNVWNDSFKSQTETTWLQGDICSVINATKFHKQARTAGCKVPDL